MNGKVRLNKVIELLEQGKTVFGALVRNGNLDDVLELGDSDYDFCYIEMEHDGFSFIDLRNSLQHFMSRKRVHEKGSLQPDVVPVVRIPPNSRESRYNQWIIKQSLDAGVYGLVLPHLSTPDDAQAAVIASRYPQLPGAPDLEPEGQRGWGSPRLASRYWGLSNQEYYDVADVWPVDPDGELILMGIVESPEGIRNLPDILREVKGIGAIWIGHGDLSVSLGARGNTDAPVVQEAMQGILKTCNEFRVPCGVVARPDNVERRVEQGFRIIIASPVRVTDSLKLGKKAAGR